jgi:catechol 2,3-dioxygenase-like lactoylglutathione lyase family enzyme
MIGYTTLGTNEPAKAKAFYDALMAELGAKRLVEMPDARELTFWGTAPNRPMLAVGRPYNGDPATAGNGTMVALPVASRAEVDRVHARALELGAADEGAPGFRGPENLGYYFAYLRDPDGNKLALFRIGAE